MQLEQVKEYLGDLPYMGLKTANRLEKIITKHDCKQILELGFYHGVSSMYFAAMLEQLGGDRKITTIDLELAKDNKPNIEELADGLGLSQRIEPHFEKRCYSWRLKQFIEEGRKFDFCYLDGGHMWDDTALSFFLVDKLLKDGGLILFDDFNWTAAQGGWHKDRPDEERESAAVERVWTLLVKDHPDYKQVWVKGNWALARKKRKLPLLPIRY